MMNPGLARAIKHFGNQSALGRALGVGPMAVSKWKRKGVPPDRAVQIEIESKGEVTRQDLRPDLFGLGAITQRKTA